MSDAWEDLGYVPRAPKARPLAPVARSEGVRWDAEHGEWIATVRKADGKRMWFYASTEGEAARLAREYLGGKR